MPIHPTRRATAVLLTTGALGVAVTTSLEVVTAPYSPAVQAYALNPGVHVAKVVAVLVLAAGLGQFALLLHRLGERLAAVTAGVVTAGTVVGAVPYSLAEAGLDGTLEPSVANDRLEQLYEAHAWIGTAASVALPLVVLGIAALAVVVLRHRVLPAWAPIGSLVAIPVAVLAGVLGDAGWVLPHPPAWLFLGLTGYGLAIWRTADVAAPREVVPA